MRVAFGTDTSNEVTTAVLVALDRLGVEVVDVASDRAWPEVGRLVGETVAAGDAEMGIACCWTGTGVAIAANKVAGVRAALCTSTEIAVGARRWNDANVVTLGVGHLSAARAAAVVEAFLDPTLDIDAEEAANIAAVTDG